MIYYLLLEFVVAYNDMATGKYKLVTADDQREEVLSIDFCCEVNAALDNLVVQVEPNVTLPTVVSGFNTAKDYEYNLEVAVVDTIQLSSLNTLFGLLTE